MKESYKTGTTVENLPAGGRIGRFIKILRKSTDEKSLLEIAHNSTDYHLLTPQERSDWWKGAVEKMESALGRDESVKVMTACGAKCCGAGQRKTAKKMMDESDGIEDFLKKLSGYKVKDNELEYHMSDDNKIIARHNRCFCGQVKNAGKAHENDIYCQCSVEFNRQFFKAALQKDVKVHLNKSILCGDDYCEFEISY